MALTESNGWDRLLEDVKATAIDHGDVEALLWDLVALLDEARAASAQLHRTTAELRSTLTAGRAGLGVAR